MNVSLAVLSFLAAVAAAPEAKPQTGPIKVLFITGVDYEGHLWKQTAPVLVGELKKDKRFELTVCETPDVLSEVKVFQFDVLYFHFKNYKPLKEAEKAKANLVKYVENGGGLSLFHFACGAFEDWPQFADVAGRVWDRKTGHDPRGPFTVSIVAKEHPITKGMGDFKADDELYTCLVGQRPIETLAVARSKVTHKDHPMAFVLQCGKGRVFHTPLGHDVKAIQMPGVGELVRRGTAWAAGRDPVAPESR